MMSVSSVIYGSAITYRVANTFTPKEAPAIPPQPAQSSVKVETVPNDDVIGLYDSTGRTQGVSAEFRVSRPNGYEIYMPTRAGYSSTNLALAVTDPGAEPFSAGLSMQQATDAARKAIDARYTQMSSEGMPFDINSSEGVDWYSAFGDLDRRALNAIDADKSGQFTEEEKSIARSIMSQQQGLATGLYSGPTRLQNTFTQSVAVTLQGPEASMNLAKAQIEWLDKVSNEEKTTSRTWAEQRAGNQWLYEDLATGLGLVPEDLSSGFSFVDMLVKSMRELADLGPGHSLEDTGSYAKAWGLFDEYNSNFASEPVTLYL